VLAEAIEMAGKRKASDDAPGTPRPPAPRRENERRYMESPHIARLFSGGGTWEFEERAVILLDFSVFRIRFLLAGSGNDSDQSTRAVVPPPPPSMRATNVMDAYSMSLQRQERELSVNLRGRAARDYARGNLALDLSPLLRFCTFCYLYSRHSLLAIRFLD
jgi:hypothetical protein